MLDGTLESNITPNVITYSMLIDMYYEEGMIEEENYVLRLMIDKGVVSNVITYSTLLDGCHLRG